MEILKEIVDLFFSFKAYVMLPFFIFVLALIARMKLGQAFLSALKMGVGFAGIFIVFAFFIDNITPAVQAIITTRGLDFPVLDVGWPPLAAITWASPIAPLSIILVMIINMVMLATNWTKTLYIDIWNYWHLAFAGALVLSVSENLFLGIIAVTLITIYSIKVADWAGPYVEKEARLPGVTIAPVSVVGILPFSIMMDAVFDKIPGLKKLDFNPERDKVKIGLIGEPMVIGALIGLLLGIVAGYGFKELLELSIHIAAVMFLLPKCGELISEGIAPISIALKEWIQKRFPKKGKLFVAVDIGVLLNNKSVMITGLILMPLALGLSLILPGNKTLPLGDLPNLITVMSVTVLICRGNVVRSVLTGLPVVASFLLIASHMAPLITRLSTATSMDIADGQLITAFTDGGHHIRFLLLQVFRGNLIAILIIPLVLGLMFFSYRKSRALALKMEKAALDKSEFEDGLT